VIAQGDLFFSENCHSIDISLNQVTKVNKQNNKQTNKQKSMKKSGIFIRSFLTRYHRGITQCSVMSSDRDSDFSKSLANTK
jgi:hypothetical protein